MPTKARPKYKLPISSKLSEQVKNIDWNFSDANTKELTHEIHRYSGKFIPQIARQAIELISVPTDLVVDPYMGSGTTILEANLLKRRAYGVDLNPLAVLISKVKTTPIPKDKLDFLVKHFEEIVFKLESRNGLFGNAYESNLLDQRRDDLWYQKWFTKEVLDDLLHLHNAIQKYPDKNSRDLALIAFSNILRKCSNAHSGYPNVMLQKGKHNRTLPGAPFLRSLKESAKKVEQLNAVYDSEIESRVDVGNAKKINLRNNSVDAIVTHPPYIGSVPYAEYGVLSLKWLGHDPKKLDHEITGGKRQSKDVVERFFLDYEKMLQEAYRVLKPNKFMFILIGDPTVKGKFIDLARKTKEISQQIGFEISAENLRSGINRRANKMGAETALFFRKP